jgi:hypothetical protein
VRSTTAVEGFSQNGVVACFIMTGLLLIGFVASETVARAPMLEVSMFRQRTFTASSVAAFGLSMAVLGPVLCLVFYMAFDQGYSELTIGTHLLLLTIVTLPFLPLTGFLDKYFPVRLLICSGLGLVAVGLWLISRLSAAGTLSDLVPGLIVAGVGLELVNPRLASAAAATVQPPAAAIASRTISTFRQIGTATGVAVFGAIFVTQLSDHIPDRTAGFAQLANENPTIASLVLDGHTARAVSSAPAAVRSQILPIIRSSFSGAIHDVFFVAALVALASAVLALLTRSSDVPRGGARQLRTQSFATQSLGTQHSDSEKSGNGSAPGHTSTPSPNGARPEPAVPATPAYATSAAATLAALGITVETPSVPDEPGTIDEADIPGELVRLRELAALDLSAPVDTVLAAPVDTDLDAPVDSEAAPDLLADPSGPDRPASVDEVDIPGELAKLRELAALDLDAPVDGATANNGAHLYLPAASPGQEARTAEPEVAEAPEVETVVAGEPGAPVAKDQAAGAWPGWPGWEAPDEAPVHMAVASPLADETLESPPAEAVPDLPAQPRLVEAAPEDTPEGTPEEGTVADFLSYWHLAETPGPATDSGFVVAETGPEGAGSPDALGLGRRWVRGQVTAATGEPMAGALVTLVNADGDEAAHAIVGSDGSFAVGDMWEGTYTLIVAAPHFRPSANTFAVGSEEAPAALSLIGIGSLAGKVTSAKDGQPMSVDIELVSPEEGVSAQGRTGKDGSFLLSDVAEGSYQLVAWSPGYRTVEVPVVVERAGTLTLVVAMVGLGHVYGAVTGPGGEWVPGAQIALTDRTGMVVATTWTDGAGSYRFAEVPEGSYTVRAAAFDAASLVVEVEAGSTVAADVTLASP